MNIKLKEIDGRWFVVVNSIGGEFKQDVTSQVQGIISNEAYKQLATLKDQEIDGMRRVINEAASCLAEYAG